jgi:hypothetical protein
MTTRADPQSQLSPSRSAEARGQAKLKALRAKLRERATADEAQESLNQGDPYE